MTKNGAALGEGACDYACKGTSGEFCGGRDKISVYVINDDGINDDVNDGFVEGDCYNDVKKARALNEEGKNNLPNLTKEVRNFCTVDQL